jgi:protein involved in polysaccharide export with SLBB domain
LEKIGGIGKLSIWKRFVFLLVGVVMAWCLPGCKEPGTIGRYRATPITNIILDNLGVVDEDPDAFAGARGPLPKDLRVVDEEYVINKGDILRIRIFELFGFGLQWEDNIQVNDTGRITLPVIGTIRAVDRTELELTDDLISHLSPQILKDPKVGVVVLSSTSKVYTVQGAISAPGPYQLSETDFRIMRALAMAGGVPQIGSNYAFVIRNRDDDEDVFDGDFSGLDAFDSVDSDWEDSGLTAPQPNETFGQEVPVFSSPEIRESPKPLEVESVKPQEELLESIAPMVLMSSIENDQETGHAESLDFIEQLELAELQRQEEESQQGEPSSAGKVVREGGRWQFQGGSDDWEWQASLEPAVGLPSPPVPQKKYEDDWDFEDLGGARAIQEVIRVDLKKLTNGDVTQNIVIRPGDDIHIPANAIGIYYVSGQVARPGPYSMNSGQRMTLRQAVIATAGPLTPTAWPSRCEITRRIGDNHEVTARFDLQKVVEGTAPDLFIKSGDVINIGSHPVARFIAVVRQSFRATYGFGFVYDRNLADKDFGH